VLTEVFKVVSEQWRILFGILLFITLGQGLVILTLKSLFHEKLTFVEFFSLGLAGWIVPISLLSMAWLFLGLASSTLLNRVMIPGGILLLIAILFRLRPNFEPGSSAKLLFILLTLILTSILIRLAFVSQAIFPSYFDSAAHYSIIKNIIQHGTAQALASTTYYHRSFHILTAFLVSALNADIARVMLILGQMVLAFMPVSVFFLVKHVTGSNSAGIFAIILSAIGWYMPAHAANWGKYPALISLALIPFVLSLAYLVLQNQAAVTLQNKWKQYIVLGLSVAVTILFHSRSLFILTIVALAWMMTLWLGKLSLRIRSLIFMIIFIGLVLEIFFIQKQAIFLPLFDPYLHKGIWITALVLLLSIFALRGYSQVVFACFLSMCLLLGSLFVPIRIPGYGTLTLLDRPLVEMILYLPLSLLGGLGLAGLEKLLPQPSAWKFLSREHIYGVIMVLIAFHALATYDFYPSNCCVLVGNEDVAALAWMQENLSRDTYIGISVTEMNVLPSDVVEGYTGGDAGIWITPLIDRNTFPLFFSSDFGQEDVRSQLCQSGVSHLYVGELGQPFDSARLDEHPEWYKVLLSMQNAKVYEVSGCG
jgi:hypothetical protein